MIDSSYRPYFSLFGSKAVVRNERESCKFLGWDQLPKLRGRPSKKRLALQQAHETAIKAEATED